MLIILYLFFLIITLVRKICIYANFDKTAYMHMVKAENKTLDYLW